MSAPRAEAEGHCPHPKSKAKLPNIYNLVHTKYLNFLIFYKIVHLIFNVLKYPIFTFQHYKALETLIFI